MKNKVFLLFVLLVFSMLIVSISVFAEETTNSEESTVFDIKIDVKVNDIYPTQTAKFLITINNPLEVEDEYKISFASSTKWSFTTDPISYLSGINVAPGDDVTFPLLIKASGDGLSYGMQSFPITIKSKNSGISKQISTQLLLRNPKPPLKEYLPSVSLGVDIPDNIDPKKSVDLNLILVNKNPLNIDELVISIRSELYNMDRVIPLASLQKKKEVFKINYDPNTPPQDDIITVKLKVGDVDFTPVSKQISIISFKDLGEDKSLSKSFLKRKEEYTFTNDGNIKDTKEVKIETSLFMLPFTKTIPRAEVVKDKDGRFFKWNLELSPKETSNVVVIKNYRPFFYILILIILGVILYYLFRNPVVIRKETKILKIEDEGISLLKVLLHIKNRSNKPIDDVKLIDRVPHIVALEKEFSVGTLQPDKIIKHEHKGTIIKWNISVLEPFEERIISYNIKSRLKIIGGLTLPSSVLKFKGKGKNMKKVLSNKALSK